ncbi:MAG: metallophosphoesterase [Bacillota bacterium]
MISRLISRLVGWTVLLVVLCAVYAYAIEPRWIHLEEVTVRVSSLPAGLEGFTIGVVADLHLDETPLETVLRATQALAARNPDVVVAVGDFASEKGKIEAINQALEPFEHPYGVPGNWDRWVENPGNQDDVRLDMLVNRGVLVAPGLWLCGIDDALLGWPSIDEAVAGAPRDAIRILLAHEPDVADWVEPEHGITLQISGHSHGGQVRLPWYGPVLLPPMGRDYPAGLASTPTHTVYTTRGIGTVHIPVRFLSPPEITLITLVGE